MLDCHVDGVGPRPSSLPSSWVSRSIPRLVRCPWWTRYQPCLRGRDDRGTTTLASLPWRCSPASPLPTQPHSASRSTTAWPFPMNGCACVHSGRGGVERLVSAHRGRCTAWLTAALSFVMGWTLRIPTLWLPCSLHPQVHACHSAGCCCCCRSDIGSLRDGRGQHPSSSYSYSS